VELFAEAARDALKTGYSLGQSVISPDCIRNGLRKASAVRVDQLSKEYKWVKRALAPLSGVRVPCERSVIYERWKDAHTLELIAQEAPNDYLPPFPLSFTEGREQLLAEQMQRIGVISERDDGRFDIPDLFRVAAKMLRMGGTPPRQGR